MPEKPGLVVLLGSGETSPSGRRVFDWLLRRLPTPVQAAILETPAGFELNSDKVAGRIGEFLVHHLRNYDPQVRIVPARKRGTPQSPDNPEIAAQIPGADVIFLGPGSPTYAVRQLAGSLTWQTLVACHRLGASLVLSSAATIAASSHALPVYEIYKVGEDPHWRDGLAFFEPYGLSLVLVPHWNNRDGGEDLDTSRCYIGQARFEPLLELLPPGATIVGIDEKTALILDLDAGTGYVQGQDNVIIQQAGTEERFGAGTQFPLSRLGPFQRPEPTSGLSPQVWEGVVAALLVASTSREMRPSPEVLTLVEEREGARTRQDWGAADELRERIADLGWQIQDTRQGPMLEPAAQRTR
jgi:hypothetical protein